MATVLILLAHLSSQKVIIQLGQDDVVSRIPEAYIGIGDLNQIEIRKKIITESLDNDLDSLRLVNTTKLGRDFSERVLGYTKSSENSQSFAFLVPKSSGGCSIHIIDKIIPKEYSVLQSNNFKIQVPLDQKCLDLQLTEIHLRYLSVNHQHNILAICELNILGKESIKCKSIDPRGYLKEKLVDLFPKFIEISGMNSQISICISFTDNMSIYQKRMIYYVFGNNSYWIELGNNFSQIRCIYLVHRSSESTDVYMLENTGRGGTIFKAVIDRRLLKLNAVNVPRFDKIVAQNVIEFRISNDFLIMALDSKTENGEYLLYIQDPNSKTIQIKLPLKPREMKILSHYSLFIPIVIMFEAQHGDLLYIFEDVLRNVFIFHFEIKDTSMCSINSLENLSYALFFYDLEKLVQKTFELAPFKGIFYDRHTQGPKNSNDTSIMMEIKEDIWEMTDFEFLDAKELRMSSHRLKYDQESMLEMQIPVRGNDLRFSHGIVYFNELIKSSQCSSNKLNPIKFAMFQNFIAVVNQSSQVITFEIKKIGKQFELVKLSAVYQLSCNISQITSMEILSSKHVTVLIENKEIVLIDLNTYHNDNWRGKNIQRISDLSDCKNIYQIHQEYLLCKRKDKFLVHWLSYNFTSKTFDIKKSTKIVKKWITFAKLSCIFISKSREFIYITIKKEETENRISWYLEYENDTFHKLYLMPDLKSKLIIDLKQTGDYLLFITKENNEYDFFARVSSFFIFFPKSKIFSTIFKKLISIETMVEANAFIVIYQTKTDSIRAAIYRVELDPYTRLHTDFEIQAGVCDSYMPAISMADFRTLQLLFICNSDNDVNSDPNLKLWNFILGDPMLPSLSDDTTTVELEINDEKYTFDPQIKAPSRKLQIPYSVNLNVKSYLRDANEKYNIFNEVFNQFSGPIRRVFLRSSNLPVVFFDTVSLISSVLVRSQIKNEDSSLTKIISLNEMPHILYRNNLIMNSKTQEIAKSNFCHQVQFLNNDKKISKEFLILFLCIDPKSHIYFLKRLNGSSFYTSIGGNASLELESTFLYQFNNYLSLIVKFKGINILYVSRILVFDNLEKSYEVNEKLMLNLNKYEKPDYKINDLTLFYELKTKLVLVIFHANDERNLIVLKYEIKINNFYQIEKIRVPFPSILAGMEILKIIFLKEDENVLVYFYTAEYIFRARLILDGVNTALELDDTYENSMTGLFSQSKIDSIGDFIAISCGVGPGFPKAEIHIYNKLQKSVAKSVISIVDESKINAKSYYIINFRLFRPNDESSTVSLAVLYCDDTLQKNKELFLKTFEIQNISVSVPSLGDGIRMQLSIVDYQNKLHDSDVKITPVHFAMSFGMLAVAVLAIVLVVISLGVYFFIYKGKSSSGQIIWLEKTSGDATHKQTGP
jgi:hypothetical protein